MTGFVRWGQAAAQHGCPSPPPPTKPSLIFSPLHYLPPTPNSICSLLEPGDTIATPRPWINFCAYTLAEIFVESSCLHQALGHQIDFCAYTLYFQCEIDYGVRFSPTMPGSAVQSTNPTSVPLSLWSRRPLSHPPTTRQVNVLWTNSRARQYSLQGCTPPST